MSVLRSSTPDSYGRGPQKFPLDTHSQVGSMIVFQAIKVLPPEAPITFTKKNSFNEMSDAGALDTAKESLDLVTQSLQGATGQKIIPLGGDRVSLYLPISFQVNESFQYDNAALGAIGGTVANVLQSGNSTVGAALGQALRSGASSLKDFFFNGTFTGEAGRIAAAAGAGAIQTGSLGLGAGVADAIRITARVTINPNLRTKFNGVNIREFAFQFKLIAKSAEESIAIKNIVKFFRFHAHPKELPGQGAFPIALEYPNMFKIKLKTQVGGAFKNVGTPIKFCYLRNISTVYNPTSAVLHPDGAPNEVDINLSFTEFKPLSRHDVVVEDNDESFDRERELSPDQLAQINRTNASRFAEQFGGGNRGNMGETIRSNQNEVASRGGL